MKIKNSKILITCCCLFAAVAAVQASPAHVDDIQFHGNNEISDGKLKDVMLTTDPSWYSFLLFWQKPKPYDKEVFLSDLLRIEKFYHQEGYLGARVARYEETYNEAGDKVRLHVYIEEGAPTLVREVQFIYEMTSEHLEPPEKYTKMVELREGKRYREELLRQDYNKLVDWFANNGFPYIQARVKPVFDEKEHRVDLEWHLKPGEYSYFGEIEVKHLGRTSTARNDGSKKKEQREHVSDGVIHRGLGLKPGQPFNQKKLVEAQSEIYRLELFQFVGIRAEFKNRPEQVPIEVRVSEAVPRTLKFGAGYGSQEGLRGFASWRHRNFLGGGRILRAQAKHAQKILPADVSLELTQPYFLSNRNDLVFTPFFVWQNEESFEVRRLGFETTFNRRLTRNSNIFFTNIIERDSVQVKGQDVAPELERLYNKSIFRVGLTHDSSDEFFNPSRGKKFIVVAEDAGRILRTPFKYMKLHTDQRLYHRISRHTVAALRLFVGTMAPIGGSENTPIEERFFAGGTNSVRGWGRQLLGPQRVDSTGSVIPVGGNSIIEGNIELRRPLFGQLAGTAFLDYGNVWRDWDGWDPLDLHYAVGAGLRYHTPIGPVRVDFAWKINKQEFDDSNYAVHISIGQAF